MNSTERKIELIMKFVEYHHPVFNEIDVFCNKTLCNECVIKAECSNEMLHQNLSYDELDILTKLFPEYFI